MYSFDLCRNFKQQQQQIQLNSTQKHKQTKRMEMNSATIRADAEPVASSVSPAKEKEWKNGKAIRCLQVPQDRYRNRTGSMVSFKEQCELYEIDLESERRRRPSKPPAVFSLRYYIMLLALFSPFVVTYSKTIINFAIIDMIHPDYITKNQSTPTTEPAPESSQTNTMRQEAPKALQFYFDDDNSCPVSEEQRARLNEDIKQDIRGTDGEKFKWDTVEQGLLKGAYSIGHALLQVAGGRLSEIYGSHFIMSASSLLIAVACLSAPFLASLHFYLIFVDLIFLGILGSFMTPALITLFSNWLTPSEKSLMLSFYLVSSRIGYALSSVFCGLLIEARLSWKYLFYSAGCTSICFSMLFFVIVRSRPNEHPFIKSEELYYLASKNTLVSEAVRMEEERQSEKGEKQAIGMKVMSGQIASGEKKGGMVEVSSKEVKEKNNRQGTSAPWGAILTNGPVWTYVITKFCVKLAGDTVQTELPAFLKRVMHFPASRNGTINASNYVIFCISCMVVGALARFANKKRPFGCSKTTIRKIFQCIASFGVGIIFVLMSVTICQETMTVILLMLLFTLTTFGTGGEAQIPLDISERYSGTIHAIGGSLAISGAIEPILVGFLLQGHAADRSRWQYVWLGASAFAFFGGFVFLIFGDATIQPFDKIGSEEKEKNSDESKLKAAYVNKSFEKDTTKSPKADGKPVAIVAADQKELPTYRDSTQI